MTFPTLSFAEFLSQHGNAMRLEMGDDGSFTAGVRERQQAALLLNEACRWAWKWGEGPLMMPCLLKSASITPTSGVIDRDAVEDSPRVSVWTTNPEASFKANDGLYLDYLRLAMPSAEGWTVVNGGAEPLTVYFQSRVLRFSGIEWVTSKLYKVGAIVYKDDECYRCQTEHTSGTFATDLAASKWLVQRIPEEISDALAARIGEQTAATVESRPAKEQSEAGKAERAIVDVHIRYLYAHLPPWFLHNGGLKPA